MFLGGWTLLHPWALWGGIVAAAAPVVVHLLTRPRPVRLPLSTLRFVREAVRARRARHRLRDLIILTLRTLAILLLALAIAQPQRSEKPSASGPKDVHAGETVRVVILDVSQSMAATHGGIEAIERAKTAAARFLRYRPGLSANLILAGATARPVFDVPSTNFDALRDELDRCRALPQRLNVNPALEEAARILNLAENEKRRRELVVISDFQSAGGDFVHTGGDTRYANWGGTVDFSPLPEGTEIQLEPYDPGALPAALPNLAILQVGARPLGSKGRRVLLTVTVGNYSPTPQKITVEVTVGAASWRLEATCAAGNSTTLTEEIELRGQGWQSGEARLVGADDALAADNVRPFVIQIHRKPTYALLTRQSASQRPSSSHFLECALLPDARLKEDASAVLRRIDPSDLDAQALAPADLIVLDHPGKLSADAIELLADLMRRGLPILYVASETVDATNLKRLAEAPGSGLQLPVEFVPPAAGQKRQNLALAPQSCKGPPFSVFGDNLEAITRGLRFSGGLDFRATGDGLKDDVRASYQDGSPCIVLTASDAGVLAVINADLGASNLPRTRAFVPLLDELVKEMLIRNRSEAADLCGELLVRELPREAGPKNGLSIHGPQATGPEATDPQAADPEATGAEESGRQFGDLVDQGVAVTWRWPSPDRPGVYQVRRDDEIVFATAVTIPAEESNLDRIGPEGLKKIAGAGGRSIYYRTEAAAAEQRDDCWKWFAVACVVCMLAELTALLGFRT